MTSSDDHDRLGAELYRLVEQLFPLSRSITGDGVRATLRVLQSYIPLSIYEVPSGTEVFDWTVPNEWNIRDAYIKNSAGTRVVDFQACNLHVLNYSVPVHAHMRLAELREHLYSLPETPTWIPYRTSYYQERWGFCLRHDQLLALEDDTYEVCVDATLAPGHLTYGECVLPGTTTDEVLLSCHICHPSLANDNLSGIAVATLLAHWLHAQPRHFTYRFLFLPGTIGAITWLAHNQAHVGRIAHGLVLSCLGDSGGLTYKRSRRGNAAIDRIVAHVAQHSGMAYELRDFTPYGYDERQFCSPGFNLPVGCLMRTANGCYPEYHTSADNLSLVQPAALAQSLAISKQIVDVVEHDCVVVNQSPMCEPQLGRRGLYTSVGGQATTKTHQMALLWVLNLADGQHSLLDIAERAGLPFATIKAAADSLKHHNLLT